MSKTILSLVVGILLSGCNSPAIRALSTPSDGLPAWMHRECGPRPNVCPGSPPSCCGETDACSGGASGVGQPGCETVAGPRAGAPAPKPRNYAPALSFPPTKSGRRPAGDGCNWCEDSPSGTICTLAVCFSDAGAPR